MHEVLVNHLGGLSLSRKSVVSVTDPGRRFRVHFISQEPDSVAQSVECLTQEPEVPGSIPGPATYFRFYFR